MLILWRYDSFTKNAFLYQYVYCKFAKHFGDIFIVFSYLLIQNL